MPKCPSCNKELFVEHYFSPSCGTDLRNIVFNEMPKINLGNIVNDGNLFFRSLKITLIMFVIIIVSFSIIEFFSESIPKSFENLFATSLGVSILGFIFYAIYTLYRFIKWISKIK